MQLSIALFWRILVVQFLSSLILLGGFLNTALMRDPALIPWKATMGFLFMAVVLGASQAALKLSLVRAVFGGRLELPDQFWRSLSFALALFCVMLALVNIAVAKAATFETWLTYKTFVPLVGLLIFVAAVPSRLPGAPKPDRVKVPAELESAGYEMRYFFSPGSGVFLWSANDNARERFGYPVSHAMLGLADELILDGDDLLARYDASVNSDNPKDEVWSESERLSFARDAQAFLRALRKSLGAEFTIIENSATPLSSP
ncbi:MAG: septation protein IspZ [Pseudomonadota bacterium]